MTTTKATIIERLEARISNECREINREDQFDDMLDECYSFTEIGGPFACMSPSRVLKEMDPVTYRCGVNDYADGLELVEIGDCYYESREVEKARDAFVDDLYSELTDLEDELTGEECKGDDQDLEKVRTLNGQIHDLQDDIQVAKKHTF